MNDSNNSQNRPWCILPWIHAASRPNGDVRLCCNANASGSELRSPDPTRGIARGDDGEHLNWKNNNFDDVWNGYWYQSIRHQMLQGQAPDACQRCVQEEKQGILSKRQWENYRWRTHMPAKVTTQATDPIYWDIRAGNHCNLECIMCSPHDSSRWAQRVKKAERAPQWMATSGDFNWARRGGCSEGFLERAMSSPANEFYFAGGEPLIQPDFWRILETNPPQHLRLNTNLSLEPQTRLLVDVIKKIPKVTINVSVDAVGKRCEWIRHPLSWDALLNNVSILQKGTDHKRHTINIACAVQVLNMWSLPDMINLWTGEMGLPVGLHGVFWPQIWDMRVLPRAFKQEIYNRITDINQYHLGQYQDRWLSDARGWSRVQGWARHMIQEDWSGQWHRTIKYLDWLDSIDNTRSPWRNVFPEIEAHL